MLRLALCALLLASLAPRLLAQTPQPTIVCEDGVCSIVDRTPITPLPSTHPPQLFPGYKAVVQSMGERSASDIVALLEGRPPEGVRPSRRPFWAGIALAFVGGILLNLTPCVLPLIPVTLMMLGLRSNEKRRRGAGIAYGLGIALSYGILGLLSVFAGLAFGTLQSSPWFSAGVALLMIALALSLFGVYTLDLSHLRKRTPPSASTPSLLVPFLTGMGFALLAGACVAPVVLETLVAAATLPARIAWMLPLSLGLGMGAPWMLLGEGLSRILPKPGVWMRWINWGFGLIALGFALHYASLAWHRFQPTQTPDTAPTAIAWITDPEEAFLEAELSNKPIFVDLWATWCRSCKALEEGPFRDPAVVAASSHCIPLRLQVENPNSPEAIALFHELGFSSLRGLPAMALLQRTTEP